MRFRSWAHIWRFSADIYWIIPSFSTLHLAFVSSDNSSSFVKIQRSMMKFQVRKLSRCILRRSWCLFISRWPNIVWIISTTRMSLPVRRINIDHHCIIMLSISSYRTPCSLSNLIRIIFIAVPFSISISSFSISIIWRLINRFIPPIPRIIQCTWRNFVRIRLLNGCIWHIVTSVDNCLI